MRKINFVEPENQSWRKWREQCVTCTNECVKLAERGVKPIFTKLYSKQKNVFAEAFNKKCAYCEQYVSSNQPGDVEHYRPKGPPYMLNWSPVLIKRDSKIVPHPGYYWLAYDFHNLLFSCARCNKVTKATNNQKFGKGQRFPIRGRYTHRPGSVSKEYPLLLNPLLDDPDDHLKIDETGVMGYRSERGKVTIDVFGLNAFGRIDHRRDCYQQIVDKINLNFMRPDDWDTAFAKIFDTSAEYTFVRKTAFEMKIRQIRNQCRVHP